MVEEPSQAIVFPFVVLKPYQRQTKGVPIVGLNHKDAEEKCFAVDNILYAEHFFEFATEDALQ